MTGRGLKDLSRSSYLGVTTDIVRDHAPHGEVAELVMLIGRNAEL